MNTFHNGYFVKLTGDLNGLASSGTLDLGTLPDKFVVTHGYLAADQGTSNNELDLGWTGDNVTNSQNAFVDGLDNSSGSAASYFQASSAGSKAQNDDDKTGVTVQVTNAGTAAIPSSETNVTAVFHGFFDYD